MKFGPFSETHLKTICAVLDRESIRYEVDRSRETVEAWQNARKEYGPVHYPTFKGMVEGTFVEIDDADVARLGDELMNFGILAPVDRPIELDAFDDFVCPKCDFSGNAMELCPRHLTPLVTFSQKVVAKKIGRTTRDKVIAGIAILFGLLFLGAEFCSKH